jgi:hypothetical protein
MSLPFVTMAPASTQTVPSILHLPDGTSIKPNASGQVSVPSNFVGALLNAGWQIITTGSSTHIP